MGRAAGKKNPPREAPRPGTPEGDYIGLSERQTPKEHPAQSPIGGGSSGGPHIINPETIRQRVPVPDPKPEFRGIMAHGVPPEQHTAHERADHMRGGPNDVKPVVPKYEKPKELPSPVPVYVVEPSHGARPLRTMAGDKYTVPISTADPIRVAGRDLDRTEIGFLVETPAGSAGAAPTGVRIDHEVGNLTVGKGFLIPAGTGSYQKFNCCDELFAVSNDGSAVTLSVVFMYGIAGAG